MNVWFFHRKYTSEAEHSPSFWINPDYEALGCWVSPHRFLTFLSLLIPSGIQGENNHPEYTGCLTISFCNWPTNLSSCGIGCIHHCAVGTKNRPRRTQSPMTWGYSCSVRHATAPNTAKVKSYDLNTWKRILVYILWTFCDEVGWVAWFHFPL